jgi:hypothetical protein
METSPTLGHLLYGHLSNQGLQLLASPQVSSHLQTYFLETLVQPHWNPNSPPPVGYRAAFLHQCDLPTEQAILFGWLYSDPPPGSPISSPTPLQPLLAVGADAQEAQAEIPAARSVALMDPDSSGSQPSTDSSPCFIAYLLQAPLEDKQLNQILEFLEQGPAAMSMAPFMVEPLPQVFLAGPPPWPRTGVRIPSGIRARSRLLLNKGKPLSFFVPVNFNPTELEAAPDIEAPSMGGPPLAFAPTQVRPKSLAVRAENSLARLDPSEEDTALGPPRRSLQAPTQVLSPSQPSGLPQRSRMSVPKVSRKLALLVGVNHYGGGFNPLPGVEADLSEMKRVLEDSQLGGFAEVVSILNPDCQQMSDAIESLFLGCYPDDLVLFYFSGYCVHDSLGKSCLTTGLSRLGNGKQVVRASVIPIDFLTAVMGDSPSHHQVIVIDYGVNTAIAQDSSFRNAAWWQLEEQLAGQAQNRAILTSGPPTQCTVHQKVNDRSLYTRYLVEGLESGMADLDGNGQISLHEWHEYARRRTLRASPALKPQLLASRLLDVAIAPASVDDPILVYRRHVEWCADLTGISPVHRVVLEHLRAHLNLPDAEAKRIEAAVLRPYQHYQAKIQSYTRAVIEGLLSKGEIKRLKVVHNTSLRALQATLGLTDRDISPVEATLFLQQRLAQRRSGVNARTQWARRVPSQNAPLFWYGYYRLMTWLRSRRMAWDEWLGQYHLRVVRVLRHLLQANLQLVLVLLRRHIGFIAGAIASLIIAIILLIVLL